ncbi:MAG: hybrid sensor histidine kinase/response regulator, partial [Hydrogenophaga sp.]|nr:hybrid sensor histidine kinase/response regulator [Hydrogenophaga sp.]
MPSPEPAHPVATQKIFRFRREYNSWVADETMEDYALRYTPRSFRKWSEWRVGHTAFGSLSFLALGALGGAVAGNYGFPHPLWGLLGGGVGVFFSHPPVAHFAARPRGGKEPPPPGARLGLPGPTPP